MKNRFEDLDIVNIGEKQGVIDRERQFVVPPIYDEVIIWRYGIEVVKDGKCGAYNYDGKLIIPVKYSAIDFYDEVAVVEDFEGNCGVYNKNAMFLLCQYKNIDVVEDLIIAEMYELQQVFTLTGKKIISVACDFIDIYGGFILALYDDDDITIYNKEGKWLLSCNDAYGDFEANAHCFVIKVSDRYKVYDKDGHCFNEEGYEDVHIAKKFVNVLEGGHWRVLCECE